jgi:hypothetical protein
VVVVVVLSSILNLVETSLRSDPFLTCKKLKTMILKKLGMCVSKELVRMSKVKLTYTRKKARFYGLAKNALNLNRTFLKLRNYYIDQGREFFCWHECHIRLVAEVTRCLETRVVECGF